VLDDEAMEDGFDNFQSLPFVGEGELRSDSEHVDSSHRKALGSGFLDHYSFLKSISGYCSCEECDFL